MLNPFNWRDGRNSYTKESEALLMDGTRTEHLEEISIQTFEDRQNVLEKVNIWTWRVASGFMGIFFLLAALVQHNDPDPLIWMVAYTIPCLLSWIFAFTATRGKQLDSRNLSSSGAKAKISWTSQKLLNFLITCHTIYCFILGIWTLVCFALYGPKSTVQKDAEQNIILLNGKVPEESGTVKMNAEEAKELFGLCLVIAWISLLRNNNFIDLGRSGVYLAISLTVTPFIAWVLVEVYENGYDRVC